MIDLNAPLEENFEWLDAICKVKAVKDLQTAKDLCDRGTYTSNLEVTDDDGSSVVRHKRKRIAKRHFDETDDSDDSENEPLAKGHNLIRKRFNTPYQTSLSLTLKSPHNKENKPKDNRRYSPDRSMPTTSKTIAVDKTPQFSDMGSKKRSSDLTSHILTELTEIKFYMKESQATMERIENLISNPGKNKNDLGVINPDIPVNVFLEKLPCKTKQELDEVDSLINEAKNLNQLVNFLYLAGGPNPHKSIYLAMQKLFSKELALLYSGQGKKKKISFCEMKLYQAVFAAVRKRHPTVTDEAIKKSVSLFLATAKSRLGTNKDLPIEETEARETEATETEALEDLGGDFP